MTQNLPGFVAAATLGSALHNNVTAAFLLTMRQVGISDLAILRAMERLPRALFLPVRYQDLATLDIGVPIDCGQTSTAPSQIGLMLQALAVEPQHRVLEIGTGSGYATALLAQLAGEVVSFERAKGLCQAAKARLLNLACQNVTLLHEDGLCPQASHRQNLGQFDRIILHGSVIKPPAWVLKALKSDGVMLVPQDIIEAKAVLDDKNLPPIKQKTQRVLRYFYEKPIRLKPKSNTKSDFCLMVQPLHQCQFVPLISGVLNHS